MSKKRRTLTQDEEKLWSHAMRNTAPLRPSSPKIANGPAATTKQPVKQPAKSKPKPLSAGPQLGAPPVPHHQMPKQRPPLEPKLDHRTLTKLRRGSVKIDATLDLHGLTADRAHRQLTDFIHRCRAAGRKYVLIITGKGLRQSTGNNPEPGILKRSVPQWLNTHPLKEYVIGYAAAHQRQGGDGALYVSLRTKIK